MVDEFVSRLIHYSCQSCWSPIVVGGGGGTLGALVRVQFNSGVLYALFRLFKYGSNYVI